MQIYRCASRAIEDKAKAKVNKQVAHARYFVTILVSSCTGIDDEFASNVFLTFVSRVVVSIAHRVDFHPSPPHVR